jgi:hypothetical protein
MAAQVNRQDATPNSFGAVVADSKGVTAADGSHFATVSGTSGGDALGSNVGNTVFFGGAGNDAFIIKASAIESSSTAATTNGYHAQDVIYDFGGAGGWSATDNDFLSLRGFGAGSTLTLASSHALDDGSAAQYYTIHNATSGVDSTLFIHSMNGKTLQLGDYNFYA